VTACGHLLYKGKEGKAHFCASQHSVPEAAQLLGCSVRTARRWLQRGRLPGRKLGRDWVVDALPLPAPATAPAKPLPPARVRARLRAAGAQLIAVGNALAAPVLRPGVVFLAWRAPRSLSVIFAIGRAHPTRGWAPIAVGLDYPFWLEGRPRWRLVRPLLRRYEQLRLWCVPALLRLPGVRSVVLDELTRLEAALEAVRARAGETPQPSQTQEDRQTERPCL
jgi:excisionase family DNA binding protein